MTVGSADVHKAVAALWESGGLNTLFQSYWAVADRSLHVSLNDAEATPGCPFPYCVFQGRAPNVAARMSGEGSSEKQHVVDHPWTFEVYAKQTSSQSAKQLAAELAEEIMKVFGGHPTTEPTDMTLDNGNLLLCRYENDWGERQDDEVHKWTVEYTIRTDVPVMV